MDSRTLDAGRLDTPAAAAVVTNEMQSAKSSSRAVVFEETQVLWRNLHFTG